MTSISNILDKQSPITILDIGAAMVDGEAPSYQGLIESGCAQLIAFEPDLTALTALRNKYPPPHLCLPLFVGNGQAATFYETSWGPTGSLFEPNTALLEKFCYLAELVTLVRTHPVETVRLDDIPEVADIDFIKIDAQGAEQMIFENAQRILSQVTLIQTEVNWLELYKGMPLFGDIDRLLRSLGFQWHTRLGTGYRSFVPLHNAGHPHAAFKQELWSDVVYVRDWMKFDQVPPQKLVKLSVLLHDLYGSFDLAHVAMAAADANGGTDYAKNYQKWICGDRQKTAEPESHSAATRQMEVPGAVRKELILPTRKLRGTIRLAGQDGRSGTAPASTSNEFIMIGNDQLIQFSVPADLKCISTYVLLEQGKWFEKEVDFVCRCAAPGMTVLDIGANVGVYSLPLAKRVGATGHVVAYEPGTINRQHLERSLGMNQCDNVTVSAAALSDCVGTGWLQLDNSGELNQLVAERTGSRAVESVAISTLDAELDRFNWTQVDIVKIDAEGQEAAIIEGGQRFFQTFSPLILFEVRHQFATNHGLISAFEALGFDIYRLLGDGSMLVSMDKAEPLDASELNLFAARPDRAMRIASAGLLARKGALPQLSGAERATAIVHYCAQPFARSMKIAESDLEHCSFREALVAYSAYRFLPALSADRRFGLLRKAYDDLLGYCQVHDSASALSSLARIALDFGHRVTAVDILQRLIDLQQLALDQPFFPASSRFEQIDGVAADNWFVYSIREALELVSVESSMFLGCNMALLELLAAQESATSEIIRRLVLAKWFRSAPAEELESQLAKLDDRGIEEDLAWCETVRSLMAGR